MSLAPRLKHLFVVLGLSLCSLTLYAIEPRSSLLLLMDTSGSMGDEIGNGNSDIKMRAAKNSALIAVRHATDQGYVEVAVLAFSGDCSNPIPKYLDFTRDQNRLAAFIRGLSADGGTPMAEAVLVASDFMHNRRNSSTSDQMIVLLADGQNDCGDVDQAVAQLRSDGVIFRHETVGFGITPNSAAAVDLRAIATATGGSYHHAANATQLNDVFMEFVETLTLIDMLGSFGSGARPPSKPKPANAGGTSSTGANSGNSQSGGGLLGSLIGQVKRPTAQSNSSGQTAGGGSGSSLFGAGGGSTEQATRDKLQTLEAACGERYNGPTAAIDHGRFYCMSAFAYSCRMKHSSNAAKRLENKNKGNHSCKALQDLDAPFSCSYCPL